MPLRVKALHGFFLPLRRRDIVVNTANIAKGGEKKNKRGGEQMSQIPRGFPGERQPY